MASCAMKQEGPRLVCLSVDQNHVIYGFDVEQGFSFVEITVIYVDCLLCWVTKVSAPINMIIIMKRRQDCN